MALLAAGPALWMLGGYHWKGWRRGVWPGLVAGLLLVAEVSIGRSVLTAMAIAGVNCLGYGDKTSWLERLGVFALLAAPTVILDWPTALIGSVVLAGLLTALFAVTRWQNAVTWKIWEAGAGFLQAAVLVVAALRH